MDFPDLSGHDRLVALDFETTGQPFPINAAEFTALPRSVKLPGLIIEVGAVELVRDGDGWTTTGKTFERRCNPDGPIDFRAGRVHGIKSHMLRTAPRFAEVWPELDAFMGDNTPLIAHAAENEIMFLNYDLRRAGVMDWDHVMFEPKHFIDTQKLGGAAFPRERRSLNVLVDRLWIDRSNRLNFHGALEDADLTALCFIELEKRHRSGGFVDTGAARMASYG